jgi:hypothetical protein
MELYIYFVVVFSRIPWVVADGDGYILCNQRHGQHSGLRSAVKIIRMRACGT